MAGSKRKRRSFDPNFKAKLALEALKERETVAQIAARYEVHPTQITKWKKTAVSGAPSLFERGIVNSNTQDETLISSLYEEIGRLKVELDWLKKKSEFIC